MKKLIALFLILLTCITLSAGAAHAERDWSQLMTTPTEEQLAEPKAYRSPYISFNPHFAPKGFTACAMDFRIDFDPAGTYICPACWTLDTSLMDENYELVWSDYGSTIDGYFGLQVLGSGEKVVIMSLWDAFCQDKAGNVTMIKPQVLFPKDAQITEHTPETNGEGSFVQCMFPFEWETGKDYRFLLEQQTSEQGTELFILSLMEPEGEEQTVLFCFDSGMTGVWMDSISGFVENFVPEMAGWPRSLEFWNVRALTRSSGAWENAAAVDFCVNSSLGIKDYEGSWNLGRDESACWIITSGIPGLCQGPEKLTGYEIPATESGVPN